MLRRETEGGEEREDKDGDGDGDGGEDAHEDQCRQRDASSRVGL